MTKQTVRQSKKAADQKFALGVTAGRAWADSGRSYAAVEAVARYVAYTLEGDDGVTDVVKEESLAVAMLKLVGDDECPLVDNGGDDRDPDYEDGWYDGVCDVFAAWVKEGS